MRQLWSLGNEYITKQQPWSVIKHDVAQAGYILSNCLHLLRIYAVTAWPVIPGTAEKILSLVTQNVKPNQIAIMSVTDFNCLPVGCSVAGKVALFSKIEDITVSELEAQFGAKLFH
mgnify:FL=1